jgi:hypothetical protein
MCRVHDKMGLRRLHQPSYEDFTTYLMKGEKGIVYENIVVIRAFLLKNDTVRSVMLELKGAL